MPSPPTPHPLTWCCAVTANVYGLWKSSGLDEGGSAIRGTCCGGDDVNNDDSGGGGGNKPSVPGPEKWLPEGKEFDDKEVPERGKYDMVDDRW